MRFKRLKEAKKTSKTDKGFSRLTFHGANDLIGLLIGLLK